VYKNNKAQRKADTDDRKQRARAKKPQNFIPQTGQKVSQHFNKSPLLMIFTIILNIKTPAHNHASITP
jgi:hypothetical protein